WLEYSVDRDAAFCFACRQFHSQSAYAENLFTEKGFRNWKYATGKDSILAKHATSNCHLDAMVMWEQYRASLISGSVFVQQSAANKRWIEDNRRYLNRIYDAILYLTRQGLALRGNDESHASWNRGNFLELLSVLSSVDDEFEQICQNMPCNAKYTSPEI